MADAIAKGQRLFDLEDQMRPLLTSGDPLKYRKAAQWIAEQLRRERDK